MYRVLLLLLIFGVASCAQPEQSEPQKAANSSDNSKDNFEGKDNSGTSNDDSSSYDSGFEEKTPVRRIDHLLMNPFDLNAYKRKKKGANSSRENRKEHYFKPDTNGIYYSYFLFNLKLEQKYIGKDVNQKTGVRQTSGGREMVVFKPDDEDQNMYNDPNETLIEFTQWYNDTDLPELAFVGWTSEEITRYFGKPDFIRFDCLVYTFNDRAMLFHEYGGRIDWLKYAHTNGPVKDSPKFRELYRKDVFGM